MTATLTIPGKAQAKQRPKITRSGNFTPKPTASYESYVKMLYVQAKLPMFIGAVSLVVDVFMSVPVSDSKKNRALKLNNQILPTKRPDLDNIVKSIKDALNKVAWADDSYVVNLIVKKRYAENDSVTITIQEVS